MQWEARGNQELVASVANLGLGVAGTSGYLAQDFVGFTQAKKLGRELGLCWSANFQLHTQNKLLKCFFSTLGDALKI